jgi:hypothetical protein
VAAGSATAIVLSTIALAVLPAGAAPGEGQAQPRIIGAACPDAQGVSLAVDFTPVLNVIDLRCAAPGQSVGEAFAAAGFVLDSPSFASSVDGVAADWADDDAPAYWSVHTSTLDGTPAGAPAEEWVYASVGLGAGPISAGQAYLMEYMPLDPETMVELKEERLVSLADLRGHTRPVAPSRPAAVAGPAAAQLAAGWLAGQIESAGGVLPGPAGTDWGLTIDALAALSAAGVGKEPFAATAAALFGSGEAYIGPAGRAASWPAVAKTVWIAGVAGLDATAFPTPAGGTRDLVAELRSRIDATGEIAPGGSPFTWSLGLLALAGTPGGAPARAITWLESWQCSEAGHADVGSYGWTNDCTSADPDTTALVIQALLAAGVPATDPSVSLAATWLAGAQDSSGGFASSFGGPNANTTGLASQTLRHLADDDATSPSASSFAAAARRGADFVASLQVTQALVAAHPDTLKPGDVGAIALDPEGLADGTTLGIDDVSADQFRRATAQAILAWAGRSLGQLTAPQVSLPEPKPDDNPTDPPGEPTDPPGEPTDPPGKPGGDGKDGPDGGSGGAGGRPGGDDDSSGQGGSTPPPGGGGSGGGGTGGGGAGGAPGGVGSGVGAVDLARVKVTIADAKWTGKRIASGLNVRVNGTRLREGTDYKATPVQTNKAVGRGAVRIDGIGGKYLGSATVTFKIVPKPVKLTGAKADNGRIAATWKRAPKAERISGYQLQYRIKGKSKWSTVKAGAAKQSATIAKLTKGKVYQVRIRAYKTVKGSKFVSAWSKVKNTKRIT